MIISTDSLKASDKSKHPFFKITLRKEKEKAPPLIQWNESTQDLPKTSIFFTEVSPYELGIFQDPQWMLEIADSTDQYVYYVFSSTNIRMIKFNL